MEIDQEFLDLLHKLRKSDEDHLLIAEKLHEMVYGNPKTTIRELVAILKSSRGCIIEHLHLYDLVEGLRKNLLDPNHPLTYTIAKIVSRAPPEDQMPLCQQALKKPEGKDRTWFTRAVVDGKVALRR